MTTYAVASCANGCAFHSTVDTTCRICSKPLAAPRILDRDGARAILLGDADGSYAAGKARTLAWLAAQS